MTPRPRLRAAPAAVRLLLALAALGLFLYACLSPGIAANGILAALAKGQFSAALYGTRLAVVAAILALTLLFGRVFCAVLCPLGTLQELFWRAGSFVRGKGGKSPPRSKRGSAFSATPSTGGGALSPDPEPRPFLSATPGGNLASMRSTFRALYRAPPQRPRLVRLGYAAPPRLRYLIPLGAGIAAALAFSPLTMLFDPISTFGRGLGAIRAFSEGGAAFFTVLIALPAAAILIAALFRGRPFCNWCPVGLTLGLFSSVAPFGVKISSRCVSCGLCEKKCPAGCVNSKEKRIDGERCVLCFSCVSVCPGGGVTYGFTYGARTEGAAGPLTESRRLFLKGAGKASLFCGAAYLLGPSLKLFARAPDASGGGNGGLPILPPGAVHSGHYDARCIGCQVCAASCPVGIIKVKSSPQPELDYTASGCQFNCVECGNVCPTGAIRRLDVEEKRRTRVALSALFFERCVVNTKHESCGACAEVCPTAAITMIAYGESGVPYLTRPVFDERYCIGCGACYVACPAAPKAFTITAVAEQTLTVGARPVEEEETGGELRVQTTEDFPF